MFVRFLRTTMAIFVLLQIAFSVVLMIDGSHDETIYNELISRKRPILTIGKLTHSSQVVLLAGQFNKPDDIYVFEIPVAETTSFSKLALSGGILLSEKWPLLYVELSKASTVVLVSDSAHDYVMLFAEDYAAAYNIKDANVAKMKLVGTRNGNIMISSTDAFSSFYLLPNDHSFRRFHYQYMGTIDTHQVFLPNTSKLRQTGDLLKFCLSTTTEFMMTIFNEDICLDSSDCLWSITSGFADNHQITLFDQYGNVYMFPRSILDADLSIPVKLVKAQLRDYFVLSKNGPTIAPHTSNVSDFSVNTRSDGSNIGFIIVIAILVIILLLGIVLYFFNPCKTSSKKEKATKAAILDSPKDKSVKATEKNDQAPQKSVKPKAKDKTSAKAAKQTGNPAGRSGRRTPKTGSKGSGPRGSRSKQNGKAKTGRTGGHRSAVPSANSSQADSAMSAQSQPQNKSSSASSAPKKDSRSGASSARNAKRTPRNSTTRSPGKPFRGGKSEKKLIQLGLDQYQGNSLK